MRFIPSKATLKELGKALAIRVGLVLSIALAILIFSLPSAPQEVKDLVGTICQWMLFIFGSLWLAIVIFAIWIESRKKSKDTPPTSPAP